MLLISVALAFFASPLAANALTVENVSVSDTGGISVSAEAGASGSSEADASVSNSIRTEGSNTRVRVDVRTNTDGEERATSIIQTIPGGRVKVRVATSSENSGAGEVSGGVSARVSGDSEVFAAPTLSPAAFDRFSSFFTRVFNFLFFFW